MFRKTFLNHPLCLPYIPNAEILDEEEFGESTANRARDGGLTASEELGLTVCIIIWIQHCHFWSYASQQNYLLTEI